MKRLLVLVLSLSVLCLPMEARRRWVPKVTAVQSATDNFNSYADGAALGSQTNWANVVGTMVVKNPLGDGIVFGSSSGDNVVQYTAGTWGPNQYAEVTVGGLAGASSMQFPGAAVRCSGTSGYYFTSDASNVYLSVYNSGAQTFINGYATTNIAGTVLRIFVTGSGSSTRITLYNNGTPIPTASNIDPGGTYLSTGNPGVAGGGVGTTTELGTTLWAASN